MTTKCCCSLSVVPTGVLSHVASFLAMPSRALFAVALNSNMDNDNDDAAATTMAILDNRTINELDFGDIDKSLTSKLSDTNITDVLTCIDAINNLKRLRLTGCINITGIGLTPLRGSLVIEKIDLTLVRDTEDPTLHPEPKISCHDVLPILDSIIEREGRALKLLLFPKVWRKEGNAESDFHAFLIRYNNMLESDEITCAGCDCLPGEFCPVNNNLNSSLHYGTQTHTCSVCMDNFCLDCTDEYGQDFIGGPCKKCERRYCAKCKAGEWCDVCEKWCCEDCVPISHCSGCTQDICVDCTPTDFCSKCNNCFCQDCNFTGYCDKCNSFSCHDCKLTGCCGECNDCFCEDCKYTGYCVKCKEFFCEDCKMVPFCGKCKDSFCEDCKYIGYCIKCKEFFCEDCKMAAFCGKCKNSFCEDCKFTGFCSKCKECFCEDCKITGFCSKCKDCFCEDCKFTVVCGVCNDWFCEDCKSTWWCDECDEFHCEDCAHEL